MQKGTLESFWRHFKIQSEAFCIKWGRKSFNSSNMYINLICQLAHGSWGEHMGFRLPALLPVTLVNYISLGWQITRHPVCEQEDPFLLFLDFRPPVEESTSKSLHDRRVGCIDMSLPWRTSTLQGTAPKIWPLKVFIHVYCINLC